MLIMIELVSNSHRLSVVVTFVSFSYKSKQNSHQYYIIGYAAKHLFPNLFSSMLSIYIAKLMLEYAIQKITY